MYHSFHFHNHTNEFYVDGIQFVCEIGYSIDLSMLDNCHHSLEVNIFYTCWTKIFLICTLEQKLQNHELQYFVLRFTSNMSIFQSKVHNLIIIIFNMKPIAIPIICKGFFGVLIGH